MSQLNLTSQFNHCSPELYLFLCPTRCMVGTLVLFKCFISRDLYDRRINIELGVISSKQWSSRSITSCWCYVRMYETTCTYISWVASSSFVLTVRWPVPIRWWTVPSGGAFVHPHIAALPIWYPSAKIHSSGHPSRVCSTVMGSMMQGRAKVVVSNSKLMMYVVSEFAVASSEPEDNNLLSPCEMFVAVTMVLVIGSPFYHHGHFDLSLGFLLG